MNRKKLVINFNELPHRATNINLARLALVFGGDDCVGYGQRCDAGCGTYCCNNFNCVETNEKVDIGGGYFANAWRCK
jgi:hypothetical protein